MMNNGNPSRSLTINPRYLAWVLAFGFIISCHAAGASSAPGVLLDLYTPASDFGTKIQFITEKDIGFEKTQDSYVINKQEGALYLVFALPSSYVYTDFAVTLKSDVPLDSGVVPVVNGKGESSFELERSLDAHDSFREERFTLRHPNFKKAAAISLKLSSDIPAVIALKEIRLEKRRGIDTLTQAFKDFFLIAPYSSVTVNIFPAPAIFGRPALTYFLPLVFIAVAILLYSRKYRLYAVIFLAALWLLLDMRMNYEFMHYVRADYLTWVKPPLEKKTLRNYGDFFPFTWWLQDHLASQTGIISFHTGETQHLPRILQYYLLPRVVKLGGKETKVHIVFRDPFLKYSGKDGKLYRGDEAITGEGSIVGTFHKDAYIFIER